MARSVSRFQRIGQWLVLGLVVAAVAYLTAVYVRWTLRERRCRRLIAEIAPQYGVDPLLVRAVMRQESGFNPFARSRSGAIGLMQVMPANARVVGIRPADLWNERTNIATGSWLLAHALEYWRTQPVDDPVPFALAEYNAGRGTVLHWVPTGTAAKADEFIQNLPNTDVRHYVKRVLKFYGEYREQEGISP